MFKFPYTGDEMVGSTKKSAIDILKLIEPYNGRNQGLSKSAMRPSKSLENLDNSIKAPEEVCFNRFIFLSYKVDANKNNIEHTEFKHKAPNKFVVMHLTCIKIAI